MNIARPVPARAALRLGAATFGTAALCGLAIPTPAAAQGAAGWPSKPIRMIVPNAPSGLADIVARLASNRMSESLGQPILVDNRPGAGGTIGTAAAVKAAPDGYTLLTVFDSHATNPHLFRKIPYDTVNDLAAISLMVRGPLVLVVNPSVPAKTVKDFLAIARAKPGVLNNAIVGPGSPARLLVEMLELTTKAKVTQVPYKGASNALSDLVGGQVDAMFATVPSIAPHLKAGRLRAIGVTSEKRSAALPGVPTMAETIPGFVSESWVAMLGPAQLPSEIVGRVNGEVRKALPELRERLGELGLDVVGSSPAEADQWIRAQIDRWGKVIREQKIVIE